MPEDPKPAESSQAQKPAESQKPAAPAPAPAAAAAAAAAESYSAADWKSRARQLGANRHAIAGALHEAGPEDRFTEQQVRDALRAFHDRELS